MKQLISCCLIILLLAGCTSATQSLLPAPPPVLASHLVVEVQGKLSLKRKGWNAYSPALPGTALQNGDLLRLDAGSEARVVCADLKLVTVRPGLNGVPCADRESSLLYDGTPVMPMRGQADAGLPIVVSPRKTKLLNAHPTLRWMAAPGVSTYTVSVLRGGSTLWSSSVDKTEIRYPESAPALEAAPTYTGTYTVLVQAGRRRSDEEGTPSLGFSLLPDEQVAAVRAAERNIRAVSGLSEAAKELLVFRLYQAHSLDAEAEDLLEASASTIQEPAVARYLGDAYMATGVARLAEKWYLEALHRSQGVNDLEGEGLASVGLGKLYEGLGNPAEATRYWQAGLQIYNSLGDAQKVSEIQQHLGELSSLYPEGMAQPDRLIERSVDAAAAGEYDRNWLINCIIAKWERIAAHARWGLVVLHSL